MMIHNSKHTNSVIDDQACLELQSSDSAIFEDQNYNFSEIEESSAGMLFKDLNFEKIPNVEPTENDEANEITNIKTNLMNFSDINK